MTIMISRPLGSHDVRFYFAGLRIGEVDDSSGPHRAAADDMSAALSWANQKWPDSDSAYRAVVWVEDETGTVLASLDVVVSAAGEVQS
jgi:hypothetical protein